MVSLQKGEIRFKLYTAMRIFPGCVERTADKTVTGERVIVSEIQFRWSRRRLRCVSKNSLFLSLKLSATCS